MNTNKQNEKKVSLVVTLRQLLEISSNMCDNNKNVVILELDRISDDQVYMSRDTINKTKEVQ